MLDGQVDKANSSNDSDNDSSNGHPKKRQRFAPDPKRRMPVNALEYLAQGSNGRVLKILEKQGVIRDVINTFYGIHLSIILVYDY